MVGGVAGLEIKILYNQIEFYTLPSVSNVLAVSGKSGVLAGIGPLPTFWPFMVVLVLSSCEGV